MRSDTFLEMGSFLFELQNRVGGGVAPDVLPHHRI